MKDYFVALVVLTSLLFAFGTPLSKEHPESEIRWGSPHPVLPMTFAHVDHATERCVDCHHNYVDETGSGLCMNCHVTEPELWPVFEEQFHALCRDCHEKKQVQREESGPTRSCIGCHLDDRLP